MKKMYLLGPGQTLNLVAKKIAEDENTESLALQQVFPYCFTIHNIEPQYWTWQDPHGCIEGLKYIVSNNQKLKKMKMVIPNYVTETHNTFREYCGTSKIDNKSKWSEYISLLEEAKKYIDYEIVPSTTIKHITLRPSLNKDYASKDLNNNQYYLRFMLKKVVYGTIDFDSDRIVGNRYKWGLENKLSSVMLPLAKHLQANEVYPVGFDFVGARFYDTNNTSGTWGKNVNGISENMQVAIDAIKKWSLWSDITNMKIKSVIEEENWILNSILEKA